MDLATFWRRFGDVWRRLAMGTHQTAAHLAHGTSLVASFPSPVSRFFPFFALSYPGTLTLAGGGMPMLLSTVEFGARLALNALFPQHEHIAIPSVFGTPPCVLAALAFAVALALCLAWVETPICVGLVRGSAVGNDGGGRTAGRLARAGAVAAAAVTVLIAVTTPPELRDASGRSERSTSSRASSSSSSHHRVPRSSSSTTRAGGGDGAGSSAHPREPVFAPSPRAARALAPARSRARLRASACLAARIAAAAASSSAASSSRVDAGADLGDDAPDRLDMVASLTCGAHLTQRPR